MKKNDIIEIVSLTVALAALACLIFALRLPAFPLFAAGAGIFFYSILTHINAVHSNASCDYIQSGEAALGALAIYGCVRFLTDNPYAVLLALSIVILLYNVYLEVLISPEKNERVLNGLLVQAALAIFLVYLTRAGEPLQPETIERAFFGFFGSIGDAYPVIAAAALFGIAVLPLSLSSYPELRLFSHGEFFFIGTQSALNAVKIGTILVRSLLTAATIAFLGVIGGFGLYGRRISRNRFPGLVTAMKLYIFAELAIILSNYTSAWYAIAISMCLSYIAFLLYARKRVCLYDRN